MFKQKAKMREKIEDYITHFNLIAHPEGGYYHETYRSDLNYNTERGTRSSSTGIHFLITKDSISHFHRLTSDETWHFHQGDALRLLEITKQGDFIETMMGHDFKLGQKLQYTVKAGNWFASTSTGEFSFVGCTVSPGFDFEDFEMGRKKQLCSDFPQHSDIINLYSLE